MRDVLCGDTVADTRTPHSESTVPLALVGKQARHSEWVVLVRAGVALPDGLWNRLAVAEDPEGHYDEYALALAQPGRRSTERRGPEVGLGHGANHYKKSSGAHNTGCLQEDDGQGRPLGWARHAKEG